MKEEFFCSCICIIVCVRIFFCRNLRFESLLLLVCSEYFMFYRVMVKKRDLFEGKSENLMLWPVFPLVRGVSAQPMLTRG